MHAACYNLSADKKIKKLLLSISNCYLGPDSKKKKENLYNKIPVKTMSERSTIILRGKAPYPKSTYRQ